MFALKEIKSNSEENAKREQSSLKRIGNFIKEARLSREQSVEELASDLKIGSHQLKACLLYTSPSPRDERLSGMPSSA